MLSFRILVLAIVLTRMGACCDAAIGEVVVLYNDGERPVRLAAGADGQEPEELTLEPGDSRPLFATSGAAVSDPQDAARQPRQLLPNQAYRVGRDSGDNSLDPRRMDLGSQAAASWQEAAGDPLTLAIPSVIKVKLLVDDDERRPREVWEPLVRQRVAQASEVLAAHTGIGLRVVAVDTWDSDDNEMQFHRSLAEFEREVNPAPAQVAIGFSSQYVIARGRVHLGGTRGPLHPHVLIKEWAPNVLEAERLELLTHEMGHFFGAAHSEQPHSVMRPVLGKGQLRVAGARLQFDAANTLLMAMLGEEIRTRGIEKIGEATPEVRRRMAEVYAAVSRRLPSDPAAQQLQGMVRAMGNRETLSDAGRVLGEVVRVAGVIKKYRDRAEQGEASDAAAKLLAENETGDQRLQTFVRQAALAAQRIGSENAEQALLLALAVAMDDSGDLGSVPHQFELVAAIEGVNDLTTREELLQAPTLRGRQDAAREFFAAAFAVLTTGSDNARSTSAVREGCFVDGEADPQLLAANRAGLVFAHALLGGVISLEDVAARFSPDEAFPALPEDGTSEANADRHLLSDAALAAELTRLERYFSQAPLYRGGQSQRD